MKTLDVVVIAIYLVLMAGMGFWFMRRNRTSDAYFKAGGRLPWWVVSLSIYATMFSSITFMSVPAMVFSGDMTYFVISFGVPIMALITVIVLVRVMVSTVGARVPRARRPYAVARDARPYRFWY